jgi:hypothetical protein
VNSLTEPEDHRITGEAFEQSDELRPASQDAILQVVCSRCGKLLRVGASFCTACGQRLIIQAPKPAEPPSINAQSEQIPPIPDIVKRSGERSIDQSTSQPATIAPRRLGYQRRHAVLIVLMAVCIGLSLAGAYIKDLNEPTSTPPPTPQVTAPVVFFWIPPTASVDQRRIKVGMTDDGRFGLSAGSIGLPKDVEGKKLTYDPYGATSNTRVWIDGDTPIFGEKDLAQYLRAVKGDMPLAWKWQKGGIRVTQTLDYVIGNPGEGDTLRIEYRLDNVDTASHQVGLRMMIDTLIGKNDGVPFLIPGQKGLTTTAVDLRGEVIPDSIKALENADLVNPGVIVNLLLKGGEATPPDRVLITGWLSENVEWDYLESVGGVGAPLRSAGEVDGKPDSTVGLFFDPQALAPGHTRIIVTYYGLGNISSIASGNKKLGLAAASSRVRQGETFYLSAIVSAPSGKETVRIELPDEIRLVAGETIEKPVQGGPDQEYTQVSWQLMACKPANDVQIKVIQQPGDVTETWSLTIDPVSLTRSGWMCP